MNSEKKIEHLKNIILEKAKISPKGFISININSFTTEELVKLNGGVPDDAPDAMTKMDHINILKKFEQERFISLLTFDEKYNKAFFALNNVEKNPTNIYHNITEDIKMKTLGIYIIDKCIYYKDNKIKINDTDRKLIDCLQYRFKEEKSSCIPINKLSKELNKTEGYIQNRIVFINKEIKRLIPGASKTIIDNLIKNVSERGYHLNPRFMIDFTK